MSLKKLQDGQKERKIMVNIHKCDKCRLSLIDEEFINHICFSGTLKDVIIDSSKPNSFLIFDGLSWHKCPKSKYPPRGNTNKNNHQGNSTIGDKK